MGESLKPILRAAAIAAFTVGVLLLFLNPPSLDGAAGMATIIVGAIALMLVAAQATVMLMGRDGMSESEFERVVQRTERLAAKPGLSIEETEFDTLVVEAIDRLPPEFRDLLETVPVVVSHRGAEHHAYGHYIGDTVARDNHPDRIVLYQDTLERDFGFDPDLLAAQVERTLRHELAHHLGWNEPGVRDLGL
jgi:predicted Zn-dependent protease with MMP-like domain